MPEKPTCQTCHEPRDPENGAVIDGQFYCHRCLFGDVDPLRVYPIGYVQNATDRGSGDFDLCTKKEGTGEKRPPASKEKEASSLDRKTHKKHRKGISRIHLHEGQAPFLYGISEEKHLTILFAFHKARPVRSRFRRGLDGKEVGVFASRTPDRLSGIGVTEVDLIKVEGTTLFVRGLDAIDGTPVLDIKLGIKSLKR